VIGYCPGNCSAQYEDELGRKLGRIDSLRSGVPATLGQIETESAALLKDYTKPEEQGRIFYQIAMSYAQVGAWKSGGVDKVIDYAQKALAQPIDPRLRLELYNYWGTAITSSDRSRPISASRADAAPVFLKGLKEAKQFNIPDAPPKDPPSFLSRMGPGMGMNEETFKRERAKHAMECQRVLRVQMLCSARDALRGQLVFLYSRIPRAPDELRKLATETLGAGPEVEKLMDALAAKCAAMDRRLSH
jgi:hypothetical protein